MRAGRCSERACAGRRSRSSRTFSQTSRSRVSQRKRLSRTRTRRTAILLLVLMTRRRTTRTRMGAPRGKKRARETAARDPSQPGACLASGSSVGSAAHRRGGPRAKTCPVTSPRCERALSPPPSAQAVSHAHQPIALAGPHACRASASATEAARGEQVKAKVEEMRAEAKVRALLRGADSRLRCRMLPPRDLLMRRYLPLVDGPRPRRRSTSRGRTRGERASRSTSTTRWWTSRASPRRRA